MSTSVIRGLSKGGRARLIIATRVVRGVRGGKSGVMGTTVVGVSDVHGIRS